MIDLDGFCHALGGDEPHLRHVALGALDGALRRASRLREDVVVWLVHPYPTRVQLTTYRASGFAVEVSQ